MKLSYETGRLCAKWFLSKRRRVEGNGMKRLVLTDGQGWGFIPMHCPGDAVLRTARSQPMWDERVVTLPCQKVRLQPGKDKEETSCHLVD
jgi:hypothetical protein